MPQRGSSILRMTGRTRREAAPSGYGPRGARGRGFDPEVHSKIAAHLRSLAEPDPRRLDQGGLRRCRLVHQGRSVKDRR